MAGLAITVDVAPLVTALERFPAALEEATRAASEVSAENIANEARARVARRTGETAEGIVVVEAPEVAGYDVIVSHPTKPGLPWWLELGTKHMTARPFFDASVALEEELHERRIGEAVATTLEAEGLGD